MRVLAWIVQRVQGRAYGMQTALGWMPRYEDFDWRGLKFTKEQWDKLMKIDPVAQKRIRISDESLFQSMDIRLPKEVLFEKQLLVSRL